MGRKAGVSLIELFTITDQINQVLPAEIAKFFRKFMAIDLKTRTSSHAIIYTGKLQSIAQTFNLKTVEEFTFSFGSLRIPLISTGVPFQLSQIREDIINDLEPNAQSWQFDIVLNDLTLILNDLIGADYIAETSTVPRHLVPKKENPPTAITGSAGIRFERSDANQPVIIRLFDPTSGSDPFIPMEQSGMVFSVTCTPPHFLIAKSQFGMTLRSLMFDYSHQYSPPQILKRGQSADWVGLAIKEATLYLPPNALGGSQFSAGLENFLIGDPFGLQGELEIQFGHSPLTPTTFVFSQDGTPRTFGNSEFNSGTLEIQALPEEEVFITVSMTAFSPPPSDSEITGWEAEFDFPQQEAVVANSATGLVKHGSKIKITPIEIVGTGVNERRLRKPTFTVRMIASGSAPKLSLHTTGITFDNLIELTGPKEKIEGLELTASAVPSNSNAQFSWECEKLGINHKGNILALHLQTEHRGKHHIKIRELGENKPSTHMRLHIRDSKEEELYIGSQAGVFAQSNLNTKINISEILGTYDLEKFHEKAELEGADAQATLLSPSSINVPNGAVAEVSIDEGGASAVYKENRHIQILFSFDKSNPMYWGDKQPWGSAGSPLSNGSFPKKDLLNWAKSFPNAHFQIIGRCDDIGSDSYNIDLANGRANAIKNLLKPIINESNIQAVGEQSIGTLLTGAVALINPDIEENSGRLINLNGASTTFPKNSNNTYGIRGNPFDPQAEKIRKKYRRADIYAISATALKPEKKIQFKALEPTHRRVLVPASNRTVLPSNNENSKADYRVKLTLGWDKPRFKGWNNIVPNLAEFEYAWTPSGTDGITTTNKVLTFYGGYVFDDLTGFTDITLGLKSEGDPEGLAKIKQANLVAGLAFGPMLASGVDFDNDAIGSAVRLGALGAIAGFASVDLGSGKKLISEESNSTLIAFEAHAETRTVRDPLESFKTQLTVDYTNTLHIDMGVLGLKTDPKQPMKLRYTKVGVEFDNSDATAPLINKIGFAYKSDSMTIEDSGLWKIDGPLGKLLRVSDFKMGVGSFWIEPTLALALNIGVVEISEASFRITFNLDSNNNPILPPNFTLRGLKAKIDIPNTLKGEGRLKIEDGGVIKAGIDMTIIPLQVKASVALAVGSPKKIAPSIFLNLFAKVQFPGGIPIGPLPIAIHGFVGQTVINGSRKITNIPDVVTREIGWWKKDPENKYMAVKSQYALGLGVVMGTLPDASFSLSLMGMVVVAFPDPEVILGVEVTLLSVPNTTAKDKKEGSTANITGLVVINPDAVIIAVSAKYEIPKILKLKIPFGAYFPAPNTKSPKEYVYIRLGADGENGRRGEPITITFLPDTLNIKAWAYLMIEGGGIQDLGGNKDWDFEGFAIGFGAGHALEWDAGPIGLSASAKILVGIGTDPLIIKGGLFVQGKLDLVVISISVKGDIILTYMLISSHSSISLNGKFCGEVDMFFFSLKGCINFSVNSAISFIPPAPPPPVKSISLTDRINSIMGEATTGTIAGRAIFDFVENADGVVKNQGVAPKDNNVVWPDTVPVLNFAHYIKDNLSSTAQFNPKSQPAGETWFGSSRLKYAYRLDNIRLIRVSDGEIVSDPSGKKLLSAWMHTAHRSSDNTSGFGSDVPSGPEATKLQLLIWKPWAWAEGTSQGGEGQPGDPVNMIDTICEPVPLPQPACLLGGEANILSMSRSFLRREHQPQGPYPSKFKGIAEAFFATNNSPEFRGTELRSFLATMGYSMTAGQIVPTMLLNINGITLTKGYRLPAIEMNHENSITHISLPWRIELDRDVQQGELVLLVCQDIKEDDAQCYMFNDLKTNIQQEVFDLNPFKISALNNNSLLRTMDAVDAIDTNPPRLGQDNHVDMFIPEGGAFIQFKAPCKSAKLYFYALSEGAVSFFISHSNGKKTDEVLYVKNASPLQIQLDSTSTIESIQIEPKLKGILLYKVCCIAQSTSQEPTCLTFETLNRGLNGRPSFTFDGFTFTALNRRQVIYQTDWLDTRSNPIKFTSDGTSEILIPSQGLKIDFPYNCQKFTIYTFIGANELKMIGIDARGKEFDLNIRIHGEEIREYIVEAEVPLQSLLIFGGENEAIIYKICCLDKGIDPQREREVQKKKDLPIPIVKSLHHEDREVQQRWNGEIMATHITKDGHRCHVVHYKLPDASSLFNQVSVELFPQTNSNITMMHLCAIDQRVVLWRNSDQEVRNEIRNGLLNNNGSSTTNIPSTMGRPIVLDPDTNYKIEIDWSWQVWQSKSDYDNAPATPQASKWQSGTRQRFDFKTANENTTIPTRQDGTNEYLFDPRDLDRYLLESEPQNGAIAHFTDDPIVFHFSQQHVANLIKQFGREFDIEVCRTDPPAQSGGDLSAIIAPLLGTLHFLTAPLEYNTTLDIRMLQAIEESPCLHSATPKLGAVTLAGIFKLLPNVMYDADLMVRKISNITDKVSVHSVNFRTSRYANPKEMIEAMGCSTDATVSPVPLLELILSSQATVPSDIRDPSDREFDRAMRNMELDTLALPTDTPRIFQIWRPRADGSGLDMVALLLDALEPLNRVASVINANKQVKIVSRCRLINAKIDNILFETARITRNSTRLLLIPRSPFTAPIDPNSLELNFITNNGSITGRKRLRSIPLTIELEGF